MYYCFLGTRVTASPTKLFGVPLTHLLPCFSATTAYIYPVPIYPLADVALLGLLLGELAGKLTGTGATAAVSGCVAPGGGVLGPLVRLLKTYSSASAGTAGGAIIAVPGGSITSLFGGANKAPPGECAAMIFRSIASVIDVMVIFFKSWMGALVPVQHLDLSCKGERPFLPDILFRSFVFCVPNMIQVATIKVLGLILLGIAWS